MKEFTPQQILDQPSLAASIIAAKDAEIARLKEKNKELSRNAFNIDALRGQVLIDERKISDLKSLIKEAAEALEYYAKNSRSWISGNEDSIAKDMLVKLKEVK